MDVIEGHRVQRVEARLAAITARRIARIDPDAARIVRQGQRARDSLAIHAALDDEEDEQFANVLRFW